MQHQREPADLKLSRVSLQRAPLPRHSPLKLSFTISSPHSSQLKTFMRGDRMLYSGFIRSLQYLVRFLRLSCRLMNHKYPRPQFQCVQKVKAPTFLDADKRRSCSSLFGETKDCGWMRRVGVSTREQDGSKGRTPGSIIITRAWSFIYPWLMDGWRKCVERPGVWAEGLCLPAASPHRNSCLSDCNRCRFTEGVKMVWQLSRP